MSKPFSDLIDAYLTDSLNAEEEAAFFEMLSSAENKAELDYILRERIDSQHLIIRDEDRKAANLVRLRKRIGELNANPRATVHRIHFLKRASFRYAAAIIILFGAGAYLWTTGKSADQALVNDNKQVQTDIPPGGEKAVLTLADGTKIDLDNTANGNLARQGSTQIVKLANGQIAYNVKGLSDKDIMWNNMSTPAGGQYKITLPDGTRVWLNAASSITYPAAFVAKNRQVKITGEAYFEVVKNKGKPFVVDINGKSTVQVLGTSFNVNAYANEESIKTTLLEGSVKITGADQSAVLKPGQQAVQVIDAPGVAMYSDRQPNNTKTIVVTSNVDIAQTLAWKNGLISFNNSDLLSVMRQLERWYDIKVTYASEVSDITLKGKMYRNVNLSDVLEFLQTMGVSTRMEGKTLIVL